MYGQCNDTQKLWAKNIYYKLLESHEDFSNIKTFSINIYLVLTGNRLAYLSMDSNIEPIIDMAIKESKNELCAMVIKRSICGTKIICLKSNINIINNIIDNNINYQTMIGKILGYRYTEDISWQHGHRYNIRYKAGDTEIYGYIVPYNKLSDGIKLDIKEDITKYSNVLLDIGIEKVFVSIDEIGIRYQK
jgi:hypothetical protein